MTQEEIAAQAAADKAAADKAAADAKAAADKAATDAAARAALGTGNVSIPAATIGRIKKDEREKGKKEALLALDETAKANGFESHADMVSFMGNLRKNGGKTAEQIAAEKQAADEAAAAAAKKPGERQNDYQARQREDQYKRDLAKANQDAEKNRRQAKRAQEETERANARYQLALKAQDCGIVGARNVEFALHSLENEFRGMDAEQLKAFDEAKFFAALGEELPNLKGATVEKKPLNTATGGGHQGDEHKSAAEAAAQAAREAYLKKVGAGGAVGTGGAGGQPKDAMAMTKEQVAEALAKYGLSPDFNHGISMVSRGGF